ncbi:hypothetical protein [Burkholderia orbicola]|uniref:hypothetical protein n=1 Tax=Burkholderia orbicola TaxID=2978683 RepID=UPI00265665B3|nr:hypothetical protein [Burkholderia orbicola]MDN7558206.1 hypothetical protein [Burkholderia orbicola]
MSFIFNLLIAALLLTAAHLDSTAALSVACGLLWIMTVLTWIAVVGRAIGEPLKKNPLGFKSVIAIIWTCVFAYVLTIGFGRVWLPIAMVFGHLFLVSVTLDKCQDAKAAR